MYGDGVGQKVWTAVTKCLHDLFEEYRNNINSPSEVQSQPSELPPSKEGGEGTRNLKTKIAKKM